MPSPDGLCRVRTMLSTIEVRKLAAAHINISYAYCTAGARGGRTTGVLKVADVTKAMKVLTGPIKAKKKKKKTEKSVRRSPASRR